MPHLENRPGVLVEDLSGPRPHQRDLRESRSGRAGRAEEMSKKAVNVSTKRIAWLESRAGQGRVSAARKSPSKAVASGYATVWLSPHPDKSGSCDGQGGMRLKVSPSRTRMRQDQVDGKGTRPADSQ